MPPLLFLTPMRTSARPSAFIWSGMPTPAIRFIAAKGHTAQRHSGFIQLLCKIKPGASAKRQGIVAVSDECIELCVAAQARDGEANEAVRGLISKVLRVPKSDIEIAKGAQSRSKTVSISNTFGSKTPEEEIERIRIILQQGIRR